MQSRKEMKLDRSPVKLLVAVALAGLFFGVTAMGELVEDLLRTSRNSLHSHASSGDIVLVKVDDQALHQVGRWPWPRRYHARLTDELTRAGANRIFFDVLFENPSDPADDKLFADAIERSGKVVLAVRSKSGLDSETTTTPRSVPSALLARKVELGSISVRYNYFNIVWRLPFAAQVGDGIAPSFAAKLANVTAAPGKEFPVDYSVTPSSIPTIPATMALEGGLRPGQLRGKDVVIGTTSDSTGDKYFIPGWGQMGGAYVHIAGAETLKRGIPVSVGWIPGFLIALSMAAFAAFRKRGREQGAALAVAIVAMLFTPAFLESHLIFADITPGLFVLLTVAIVLTWRRFRRRGLVNPATGLANLAALKSSREGRSKVLIAVRIHNYADIVANLSTNAERQLVEQIVARLRVGSQNRILYQGDGGIFAWFEESQLPFGNHLDALYALFRNAARVDGMSVDLSVSFGVEIGSGRSLANRLASALVAAEEAAHDGLKWKYHDPETLQDASWRLSMMSQLDAAIDKGEVWVAYQPKLDLKTKVIVGAEALARWTHPEKGPIAASEFVAAAEQHDRIGKLTDFVLEKALAAGADLHRRQPGFEIAVNLSARLLSDHGFPLRLRAMLARHGLPPANLTLELTETAELAANGPAMDLLAALRDHGIGISIDDYGTGLSTLEYLKKIPAGEIKIDQSFVKGMVENRSDRVMVQSTIALAHSLGRRVVAEGVEQREALEALIEMECDLAQGFIIGRPMSLESLLKRIAAARRSRVA